MACTHRFIILTVLLAQGLFAREGPSPLSGELRRSPIQIGMQFMTGYRSNYVFRGVEVGKQAIEAQVASSIALSNDWALAGEMDLVRTFASDHVTHLTLQSELQYYITDECTVGPTMAAQFYDGSPQFKSGVEPGVALRWNPSPSWSIWGTGAYDSGQKGFYANTGVTWQPLVTKNTAWVNTVALGTSSDYLDESGPSDLMLRTGLNIRMGPSFRLEPFLSVTFGFGDRKPHTVAAGVWLTWTY